MPITYVVAMQTAPEQRRIRIDTLTPHPAYVRHHLDVRADEIASLHRMKNSLIEPIIVSSQLVVLDGYTRLKLAKHGGQTHIECLVYDLDEHETTRLFVQKHLPNSGYNAFVRILLALEIEPALREQARNNQQKGGKEKGLSRLTEAQRLDVRAEIARIASVGAGNVTKVQQILDGVAPEVIVALRAGKVSIARAWRWRLLSSEDQRMRVAAISVQKFTRNLNKLLSEPNRTEEAQPSVAEPSFLIALHRLTVKTPTAIPLVVIDTPGSGIFISRNLFERINRQSELWSA